LGYPKRAQPSAIAPLDTIKKSRARGCSVEASWAAISAIRFGRVASKREPILMMMRRAFARCRRAARGSENGGMDGETTGSVTRARLPRLWGGEKGKAPLHCADPDGDGWAGAAKLSHRAGPNPYLPSAVWVLRLGTPMITGAVGAPGLPGAWRDVRRRPGVGVASSLCDTDE
jgi:hypothetical protein